MLMNYVLAFTLAMLSFIAIDDLRLSRFADVTVSQSKLMKNKISRNISKLRSYVGVGKNKANRC